MNWDAVGAIGELLGSITVLITLIYLAIQTRSISKQSKAEARYAFVEAMGAINMVVAQNEKNASVWRRGLDSADNLDSDECIQFLMFVGQYANLWSVMYQLYDDGMLPEQQWIIVVNDIVGILGSGGGRFFWENGGRAAFDSKFSDFIQSVLDDNSQTYDMAKMARRDTQK